jgi:hypothetical protein
MRSRVLLGLLISIGLLLPFTLSFALSFLSTIIFGQRGLLLLSIRIQHGCWVNILFILSLSSPCLEIGFERVLLGLQSVLRVSKFLDQHSKQV